MTLTAKQHAPCTRSRRGFSDLSAPGDENRHRPAVMVTLMGLGVMLAAACEPAASPEPTIAIDSAGVEIVTSDPLRSDATCTLGEEPIFRVGDNEDDEAQWFSSVRGVGRLSDGSIAVVDRRTAEVRIFDETGRHLRTMGRPGEGPGEFNDAWRLWVLPGDTLWVGDYRPWRFNVFTAGGEWVRAVRLNPIYPNPSRSGGVLDNGLSINTTEGWGDRTRRRDFTVPDTLVVEVHDAHGDMIGTLARLPTRPAGQTKASEAINLVLRPTFASSAVMDAGGNTIALGHGRGPEVRLLDGQFRLRRIVRWSDPERDVTGSDVQAWRDEYIQSRGGRNSPGWRDFDDALIDPQIPAADMFPTMSSVMIGRDGRLWVYPYRRPGADAPRWMVFEPDGRFLCHLENQHARLATTYEIGADYLLGVEADELGVQTAVMYRLRTPADPSATE